MTKRINPITAKTFYSKEHVSPIKQTTKENQMLKVQKNENNQSKKLSTQINISKETNTEMNKDENIRITKFDNLFSFSEQPTLFYVECLILST